VSRVMEEIGIMLELKNENPFKSRAYYSAARIIDLMGDEELELLVREDKLKDVKGIGAALNEKLKELVQTGNLTYYKELKASIPEGLFEILKIPGLGPRKVRVLHDTLGITTLAELEYACRENRLVSLKGFGSKTQQNIIDGIDLLRHHQGRHFYTEAKSRADQLIAALRNVPEVINLSLAGSIRRCREIVKDIDLVAASDDSSLMGDIFSVLPDVEQVIAHGEKKVTVQLKGGINADLRVVKPEQFPYALHHFTGSKEHNTALRSRAKSLGLKMNEYGLFRGDELIPCSSEEDLFAALGLVFIPPELRENNGEIEAAGKGVLPHLVEAADIRGIFHLHTTYSDGSSSMEELIQSCIDSGYEYIGISDHSQSAFYAGGLKEDDLKQQEEEIHGLREKYPELTIFWGIESDIRIDGSLDYSDSVLEQFDFVIASVHSGLKMERNKMNERLKRVLEHPLVTILGHPTNRLLLGREASALDLDLVFETAQNNEVVLELNANPARLDLDWRYLKKARDKGLRISINPDAHNVEGIGDTDFGVAIARKGWLEKKDIFNSMKRNDMKKYLETRRQLFSNTASDKG